MSKFLQYFYYASTYVYEIFNLISKINIVISMNFDFIRLTINFLLTVNIIFYIILIIYY